MKHKIYRTSLSFGYIHNLLERMSTGFDFRVCFQPHWPQLADDVIVGQKKFTDVYSPILTHFIMLLCLSPVSAVLSDQFISLFVNWFQDTFAQNLSLLF